MTFPDTIETTFDDAARTVDRVAGRVAGSVPAPLDALVVRIGAIEAELLRQTGLVTATGIDAVTGVGRVIWTGVDDLAERTEGAVDGSLDRLRTAGRRSVSALRGAGTRIGSEARAASGDIARGLSAVEDELDEVDSDVRTEARAAGRRTGRAVDTAVAAASAAGARTPSGPYESWTKDDLYERAQELDVEGRSQMTKDELVAALRSAS